MRNDTRDHHRCNGGYIMGVKSPKWFTDYFGEYDTRKFAESGKPCAHCGRHGGRYGVGALSGDCYLGLCADCWTSLLWHCLEVVNRQIDHHPEKWWDERPDGLQLALHKIRRNVELGTFNLLCEVAIDGVPNTRLKEAQKEAVRKERNRAKSRKYYQRRREEVRARQNAYRAANLERCREYSRRWAMEHRDARRATAHKYYMAHREEAMAYRREWNRRNRDKINAYRRKWVRKKREEMRNGQQDV